MLMNHSMLIKNKNKGIVMNKRNGLREYIKRSS